MRLINFVTAVLLGAAAILPLTSCEDQLDVPQKGVQSTADYYQTDDESEKAAIYMYSVLKDNVYSWLMIKNCLADEVYAGGRGMAHDEVNEFTFTSDNNAITGMFQALYNQIYASNLILNHTTPDTPGKSKNYAEALFFRAWSYFDLVTLWGNPPLVLEAQRDDYRCSNTPGVEVWNQIEKDLREALELNTLPEKSGVNDKETPIRVTKQTVQALLGKVYLWQQRYQEAASVLDEVIASGKYRLMDLGEYGYMEYFSTYNDNHSEVLLEINRLNDPANFGFDMNIMFFGLPINRFDGVMDPKNKFFSETWGFASMLLEPLVKDFQDNCAKNGAEDLRYRTVCLTPEYLEEAFGLTIKPGGFFEGSCGYGFGKWICWQENHIDMTWAGFMQNTCLMRYAEVLLLAAEAHLMAGNTTKALDYVNQIRIHAGEPALGSISLEDLKMEKRLELCGECVRFQDLLRWGDAYDKLKDQGKRIGYFGYVDPTKPDVLTLEYRIQQPEAGFKTGKHELLPYPYTEIINNPNIQQNPGY